MDELRKILEELISITESEWENFSVNLKRREYKAKTVLIKEGKVARKLYFIADGLLRTYSLQEGKEISTYFACDNQFISVFSSFIGQTSSSETLETIEDSIVYELSYKALTKQYMESSKFEKLGRIIAEKNYLCVIDRTLTMQTKSAKQKYLDFIYKNHKKIVLRVLQYQIASFLGITPESLSRIRKEISIS